MRKFSFAKTALLTLLVPGLGHFYNGQVTKGIVLFFICNIVYYGPIYAGLIYTTIGLFACVSVNLIIILYILYDSSVIAKKTDNPLQKWYTKWPYLLMLFVLSTLVDLCIDSLSFIPKTYNIPSSSMGNTLIVGDTTLIDLTAYGTNHPEYDDVIVFVYPEDETMHFIKRVIGKPGDTVCIENKQVFVNGQTRADGYTIHTDTKSQKRRDTMPPMTIPPDSYFVLGDNRDESYDSRFFGPIAKEKIIGKARIIIWSDTLSRIGKTL